MRKRRLAPPLQTPALNPHQQQVKTPKDRNKGPTAEQDTLPSSLEVQCATAARPAFPLKLLLSYEVASSPHWLLPYPTFPPLHLRAQASKKRLQSPFVPPNLTPANVPEKWTSKALGSLVLVPANPKLRIWVLHITKSNPTFQMWTVYGGVLNFNEVIKMELLFFQILSVMLRQIALSCSLPVSS